MMTLSMLIRRLKSGFVSILSLIEPSVQLSSSVEPRVDRRRLWTSDFPRWGADLQGVASFRPPFNNKVKWVTDNPLNTPVHYLCSYLSQNDR